MKITKVNKKNGELQHPVSVELNAAVEKICKGAGSRRQSWLVFSGTFGQQGFSQLTRMSGLLLMAADGSPRQVDEWQRQVMEVPYTVLSFRSRDRHRLYVVVRVARADGKAPADADEYLQLLTEAQQKVMPVYESLAGCRFCRQELTLDAGCPMSSDPQAGYHPDAQAFPVIIKPADPLAGYRTGSSETDGVGTGDTYTAEERERLRLEFYTCLQRVMEELPADSDDEQQLLALACQCRKARLEEEPSVRRTLWLPQYHGQDDIVRKVFRTVYTRRQTAKPASAMNQKERIARAIRDFFSRRYLLRYNVVKQQTEYLPNDGHTNEWLPLTDRDLRRIAFEEMLEGGQGWMIDIELYVNSSLVPRYHPVLAFLGSVGQWDHKRNYIEDYARRLKTDFDRWPHFFHRWFLAMVAQVMGKSRDYGNSMVPLLIGPQAMKKSTFCKNILPPVMREYYMDDIKMDNAEQVERVLGRMWLVNIDEYNAKTDREQAKIKRLLTEKDVQIRKMRSDQYTMTPRLCSFIATTNDTQPLCDPSGSRRYLCVEMTGQADMEGTVNYRQMYAQAVWELEHGEQYWFSNDDEREITLHNQRYFQRTPVEEVLSNLFVPADKHQEHFLTATAIQQQLSHQLRPVDVPPLRKLGLALKRLHFPEGSHSGQHGYYLHRRE